MKSNKGVTLIILMITIAILIILAVTVTVNLDSYNRERNYNNFENDLTVLKEAVSLYYAKNGELPIRNKYTNLNSINGIKNINDNENYYVIDIDELNGIELNFGKDYEQIKTSDISTEISQHIDIYIINEQSHTIYYVKGIEYLGTMRYTLSESYADVSQGYSPIQVLKEYGGYVTQNTQIKDEHGNKVMIPEGFKIAEDSGLTVEEGIVIEDNDIIEGIGNNRGNQYVWIPVGTGINKSDGTTVDITLGRYDFADGTNDIGEDGVTPLSLGTPILVQNINDYKNQADDIKISNYFYEDIRQRDGVSSSGLDGLNATALSIQNFKKSVEQNGGYYIARYEASYGTDGKANSKISNNVLEEAPTTEGALWNYIRQKDAAKASREIYDTVTADLINSYAWDTAIVYIQEFSGETDYSYQTSKNTGSIPANTGVNNDEVCKINDMASNTYEWTTEYSTYTENTRAYPCTFRGGNVNTGNNIQYTRSRNRHYATHKYIWNTFRVILYI